MVCCASCFGPTCSICSVYIPALPVTGDMYHILEPDAGPSEPDLYAVPSKGKGPGRKVGFSAIFCKNNNNF